MCVIFQGRRKYEEKAAYTFWWNSFQTTLISFSSGWRVLSPLNLGHNWTFGVNTKRRFRGCCGKGFSRQWRETPMGRTRAEPGRAILSKVKFRFEVMFHFFILIWESAMVVKRELNVYYSKQSLYSSSSQEDSSRRTREVGTYNQLCRWDKQGISRRVSAQWLCISYFMAAAPVMADLHLTQLQPLTSRRNRSKHFFLPDCVCLNESETK